MEQRVMIKKLVYLILLLPIYLSGQNNFFWSHSMFAPYMFLDFQAYKSEQPEQKEFYVIPSTWSSYINNGIKYYDIYETTINPPDDATGTKDFSLYPELVDIYKNFMNYDPYYSIWLEGVSIPQSEDIVTIYTDIYFEQTKTIHVGIMGDNYFSISVNSELIVQSKHLYETSNFSYCNIFPITVNAGNNRFSFSGKGDGTVSQALGVVIWDNNKNELFTNPINRNDWNILWSSNNTLDQDLYLCSSLDYTYDIESGLCIKVSNIDDWENGDDLFISMYVPTMYQGMIQNWYLKDISNNILDSGIEYKPTTIISGLNPGVHTFKYEIIIGGTTYSYSDNIELIGEEEYPFIVLGENVEGGGIFVSDDGGNSWNKITTGFTYHIPRSISVGYNIHNIVVTGNSATDEAVAFWSNPTGSIKELISKPPWVQGNYWGPSYCSYDGTCFYWLRAHTGAYIWYSLNSGYSNNTLSNIGINNPTSITSSFDNSKIYIGGYANDYIRKSTTGINGTFSSIVIWSGYNTPGVTCSSDGQIVYVVKGSPSTDLVIAKSTDGLNSTTDITIATGLISNYNRTVLCSADGKHVLVVDNTSKVAYVSNNYGALGSWTQVLSNYKPWNNWGTCSVSFSGKYMILGETSVTNKYHLSTDYGVTWTLKDAPINYPTSTYVIGTAIQD